MVDIVLATINARYAHASLGLRCLRANLGAWRKRSQIVEFTLEERPSDMAERLLALRPRVLGLGVYIWNARVIAELLSILKSVRSELTVVLGGPEVSYDPEAIAMVALADYVITGEGEKCFAKLVGQIFSNNHPAIKIIAGQPADLTEMQLPYSEYSDVDLEQRNIYVEASRGCVFGCEFCLSSLDRQVRRVPLAQFFAAMTELWQRGLRRFRFVDRTFNLKPELSCKLLEFFADRICPELFVHVEVIADQLPMQLLEMLARFPKGALQLEVGVQSLNDEVVARIGRQQQGDQAIAAINKLRAQTQVHLHVDLIIGLPGENLDSIAASFDRLYATKPHEIQVGILKRLRGATISRHDIDWHMVYAALPPYELLQNCHLDFVLMQKLKRFARYWDLVANSGRYPQATSVLCATSSPFASFLGFSDWLFAKIAKTHQIAPARLALLIGDYLVETRGLSTMAAKQLIDPVNANSAPKHLPKRQARHH